MTELQEDVQLLVDSLRYKNDDEEQQRQALQTIATMCSENANANEYFCEHGGLDFVVEMIKNGSGADGVQQAALYCISAAIEENVGTQMKLCNEEMFRCIYELLQCERSSNGMKATAVYLINSLIHNNGTGQNLCRTSKVLLKLINMFKMYVDPMLSTDGASAGDKAMTVTPTAATDGLELWISVCNTLGSACNNPQNEINQQRCAQLFAGAVSLLRPPIKLKMIRPAVSLLNYCISGHYMNRERIRLVGGLRAILTLLKELLSDSISDPDQLEQAVHLVRLLTTCVTDNGVNQKVAAQLEAVTVLLQLLRNELLDTSQKLCIVMCLAVLSDGNKGIQQQLADNGGFGLLVQVMATSKNDELCRVAIYVLHLCLKEKTTTDDPLADDIERLDMMLNTSYEIAKCNHEAPDDGDEQAVHNSRYVIDKEVTVEEKHFHVQQWLDGIGTDNAEDIGLATCEMKSNQPFSCLIPLLQLLFTKGVLDEVRPHLPASLQNEIDKLCHQSLTVQEDATDPSDGKAAPCTHVNETQDSMKDLKDNADNIINPTLNCQTNKKVINAEKELVTEPNNTETKQRQLDSNFNYNKSMFMDDSTNITHAESKAADKQYCIDSPRLPRQHQVMSEKENVVEKNATNLTLIKHSNKPKPVGVMKEANHSFSHVPDLVPVSSRSIHHATPCLHQGPKRLLKPTMCCLGCVPHPDGVILTSRNYLISLQSNKHTCPVHSRLVDKHYNSAHPQKFHCAVELPLNSERVDTLIDHDSIQLQLDNTLTDHDATQLQFDNTLTGHNTTQLQLDNIDIVTDHGTTQPQYQDLASCSNVNKTQHDEEASSPQALQDITNANALNLFDFRTPVKQEPRPTQLINVKPFKKSSSHAEFTPIEEKYILEGVQRLGKRWRHILNAYPFHPSHTQVNIKDKYRQLCTK